MRLLSRDEIRQADAIAINDFGIPSIVLMENAGRELALEAGKMLEELAGNKVVIVCGGGNNGGDGFVAARHLHNMGYGVRIFITSGVEKLKGDALTNWQIVENIGLETQHISDDRRLNILKVVLMQSDLIIDCLFGTGLEDNVRGLALNLISIINESGRPVLACDIPSGLCADKGVPLGIALKAEKTVTFGYGKIGLYIAQAPEYTGKVKVVDISLPKELESRISSRRELLDEDFCRRWLPPRDKQSHKGNFGHLLVFAGSPTMPGAAVMAGKGALRMGVGLLSAAIPTSIRDIFCTSLPEAMMLALPEAEKGVVSSEACQVLAAFPAAAYLLGPGLGKDPETVSLIQNLIPKLKKSAVIDADALNALAGKENLLAVGGQLHVITPHPGELSRLSGVKIGDIQKDRIKAAVEYAAKSRAVVVLKGAGTVVADPNGRIFINTSGNPGMATGGSGDVLSGIIAALLAQGLPPAIAAACGVWLHGAAGDEAAASKSRLSMLPTDICEYLPIIHKRLNSLL